jgi:hypothetical protein
MLVNTLLDVPETTFAFSNVLLHSATCDFALEQGKKANPRREALALGVLDVLHKKLSPNFAATKKKTVLDMNICIVDVLEGDREASIFSCQNTRMFGPTLRGSAGSSVCGMDQSSWREAEWAT